MVWLFDQELGRGITRALGNKTLEKRYIELVEWLKNIKKICILHWGPMKHFHITCFLVMRIET